jgi:subtilisin family serine protease
MRQAFQCMIAGVGAAGILAVLSATPLVSDGAALRRSGLIHRPLQENRYSLTSGAIRNSEIRGRGPEQYVRDKLQLSAVHRLARGTNIPIGVIDSEIDERHPDLNGAVSDQYEPTGIKELPHAHGTGIAGAIAARQTLVGVAPGAHILGIRAFSGHAEEPTASASNILKGLDWAVNHNVRIVNMSFTGARDPLLDGALKGAYDKGVILIAAVGNAGPGAQPLFPAADPHVIAVTATDANNKLFPDANRGRHVAIAAPGVEILVPAPDSGYQLMTGTSIAAAHVSGVVALMLESNPKLTPAKVRKILLASAKRLGPSDRFGAGLVDPVRALEFAKPRGTEPSKEL